VSLNFTAGMTAQEEEGGGRVLLGDNTGQRVVIVP